ncbi:hypothetical protein [Ferrovibrio sp.]|uniref:hypothetical protein n=1 Tax=Ferrovibrio sp. TaxID=1917215 RepID=UPI003D1066DA
MKPLFPASERLSPKAFAKITATLEDATILAVKGQSHRLTPMQRQRIARQLFLKIKAAGKAIAP